MSRGERRKVIGVRGKENRKGIRGRRNRIRG
jgi:hypothetical protein